MRKEGGKGIYMKEGKANIYEGKEEEYMKERICGRRRVPYMLLYTCIYTLKRKKIVGRTLSCLWRKRKEKRNETEDSLSLSLSLSGNSGLSMGREPMERQIISKKKYVETLYAGFCGCLLTCVALVPAPPFLYFTPCCPSSLPCPYHCLPYLCYLHYLPSRIYGGGY
jgi:hypothetical protein